MPRLSATTRPIDQARVFRLILAWLDGDRFACDVVIEEAMAEPVGVPGLLFELTGFTAELAERCVPDARDQLRAALLSLAGDEEEQ